MKTQKSKWMLCLLVIIFAFAMPTFADSDKPSVSKTEFKQPLVV